MDSQFQHGGGGGGGHGGRNYGAQRQPYQHRQRDGQGQGHGGGHSQHHGNQHHNNNNNNYNNNNNNNNQDPNNPGQGGKKTKRTVTDFGSTITRWARTNKSRLAISTCANRRTVALGSSLREIERPSQSYIVDMEMPISRPSRAVDSIPAKHVHVSVNRERHVVYVVFWTPDGRRLVSASLSGEFTLWNGTGFNFESISQAHSTSIRAARYSNNDDWLLSGDNYGFVKYWQPSFNEVQLIKAHPEPIRGIAFAPTDTKFVTASEDSKLKVFDFANGVEEVTLSGHSWELRCVDWHPTKGLIVSGSKDGTAKLWDPRTGTKCLTTLAGHKGQVAATLFERTGGHLLATGSRDQLVRVFDLRMMRDVYVLRGNEREITSVVWHPIHRNMISTGANDGSIRHFLLDEPNTPASAASTLTPYDVISPAYAATNGPGAGMMQLPNGASGVGGGIDTTTQSSSHHNRGPYFPSILDHPPQTIYPAHSIGVAHEQAAVWSLAWHPAGHLLASGGQDRMTRFWTRPRPGDRSYLADRYHIGQANAEAHAAQLLRLKEMEKQQIAAGIAPVAGAGVGGTGDAADAAAGAVGLNINLPGIGAGTQLPPPPGGIPPATGEYDEYYDEDQEQDQLPDQQMQLPGLPGFNPNSAQQQRPYQPQNQQQHSRTTSWNPGPHQHQQQGPGGAPPPPPGGPPPEISIEMAQQLLTLPAEMIAQLPGPVLAQIRNFGLNVPVGGGGGGGGGPPGHGPPPGFGGNGRGGYAPRGGRR